MLPLTVDGIAVLARDYINIFVDVKFSFNLFLFTMPQCIMDMAYEANITDLIKN